MSRIGVDELREGRRLEAEGGNHRERDADDREQAKRTLEKQVRQGKRIVLIEDRKRQRQRCMVPDEFNGPRCVTLMELTEVKRRYGERGERVQGARLDS